MADDFDFAEDFDDVRTYPETSDVDSVIEQYRARARKYGKLGIVMIFTPFLIFVVAFLPLGEYTDPTLVLTLVTTVFIAIGGISVLFFYGIGSSMLVKGYEILERVSPPDPMLIGRYVVTQIDDVYLLVHSLMGYLFAISFREIPQTSASGKVKLPRGFYSWEKKINTDRIEMYRKEGTFSIPSLQGDYIEGDAVLYCAPYVPSRHYRRIPEFSKEDLISIVESIKEDANQQY